METIANANFSDFANDVAEVQELLKQKVTLVKGEEGKNNVSRTDAQVYNYVAKGATKVDLSGENWLDRTSAENMACTQISGDVMKEVIGYKLPEIKVATARSTGVKCSYFVTNEGKVFVWPPYVHKKTLWVNGETKLVDSKGNDILPTGLEAYPKSGSFIFDIGNAKIKVASGYPPTELFDNKGRNNITYNLVINNPNDLYEKTGITIFFNARETNGDQHKSPLGREANVLYRLGDAD
jgi:flagellar basal body rod protein FlgG